MDIERNIGETLGSMVVTIDGPAGSGKSTTASILAKRLGFRYIDTGAMYRGVTYAILKDGVDPDDGEAAGRIACSIGLELKREGEASVLYLDGRNVEKEIRSPEVSRHVSSVSRHRQVREAMVQLQRSISAKGGVVAEGRDTGSVVYPYAHVKVFLVADIDERAHRRREQLGSMGVTQTLDEIRDNIVRRDAIDSGREHSPLVRPPGSVIVDTSHLTIEQQVAAIEECVRREAQRLCALTVWKGEKDDRARMRLHYRISHTFMRLFWKVLFGFRIVGGDNLRYRENFIFSSNHISYADPPIVGCGLNREVSFIAKKELFENWFLARLIRTYNAVPIDREEIDRTALKLISKKLQAGGSVLMFPEGTRSRSGEIGELKGGLGFLALYTGVTIVPVYIMGSNDLMKCFLRMQRLEMRIGPPMRIPKGYVPGDRRSEYRILSAMVLEALRMLKYESEA
jgi:cytidylate kinase